MTNKTFSDKVKEKIRQTSLDRNEKSLKKKFWEIVNDKNLYVLAKKTHPTHKLFYANNYPILHEPEGTVAMKEDHVSWTFGIFDDLFPGINYVNNYPDLFKRFGKQIRKEICFVGDKREYNEIYCEDTKQPPLIISKFVIEKGDKTIDTILKKLNKEKEIYSTRAYYDEDENEFSGNGLLYRDSHLICSPLPWKEHYMGKGLTSKKLEKLIIENWVKPLSYL